MTYSLKEDSDGLDIVILMDHQRITQQALHWEVLGFKRGPGCCLYNALHSSIVQIIKLLGPIACRMSGCRVSGSGRGHH